MLTLIRVHYDGATYVTRSALAVDACVGDAIDYDGRLLLEVKARVLRVGAGNKVAVDATVVAVDGRTFGQIAAELARAWRAPGFNLDELVTATLADVGFHPQSTNEEVPSA